LHVTESIVEEATLSWLSSLSHASVFGPDITSEEPAAERESFVKESAKAKLRVIVRRLLRKYGYAPDKQEKATQTVLEQAELLCKEWAY